MTGITLTPESLGAPKCPHCGCQKSSVVWTKSAAKTRDGKRLRKRQCGSPICRKTYLSRVDQPEVERVVGG